MEYLELDASSSPSSSSSSSSSPCKPCIGVESSSSSAVWHKRKAGRKKFKETRHPVYRGVRQRRGNRWVCEVREPFKKSRIWLGTFPSPEMAARAYDVAALALRGTSAALNFPDSASILPRPTSSSAIDIQTAALAAAEAFRHPTCTSSNQVSNIDEEIKVPIDQMSEEKINDPILFMDEEALFNMPGLLASMAEGMLLTPPAMQKEVDHSDDHDDTDFTINIDLWN